MGGMQCNVEFGYQLSIRSGTKENHGNLSQVGRSQDLPDAERRSTFFYITYKFSSYLTGNTIHLRSVARNSDH
jgi:hypothetical protein